ncbi:MAG TPA: NYN domain-containing protein [Longimicrobiales bacterium]
MPKKVSFLVDGFNMYHSLKQLHGISKASVKWLDLVTLCKGYLQSVRAEIGERVDLAQVHYFSARPDFLAIRKPDTVFRYDTHIAAFRRSGVVVHLAQFKSKDTTCPQCKHRFRRPEEKETDVAMAMKMVEVLVRKECDTVVLVTGDTDLIPAIRTVNSLLPLAKIGVGFPFLRHNNSLREAANYSFKINQKDILRAQFPPEIVLPDGTKLTKPQSW